MRTRNCNKCCDLINVGDEYIKLQSQQYINKKIVYKNYGDLCLKCYNSLIAQKEVNKQ